MALAMRLAPRVRDHAAAFAALGKAILNAIAVGGDDETVVAFSAAWTERAADQGAGQKNC